MNEDELRWSNLLGSPALQSPYMAHNLRGLQTSAFISSFLFCLGQPTASRTFPTSAASKISDITRYQIVSMVVDLSRAPYRNQSQVPLLSLWDAPPGIPPSFQMNRSHTLAMCSCSSCLKMLVDCVKMQSIHQAMPGDQIVSFLVEVGFPMSRRAHLRRSTIGNLRVLRWSNGRQHVQYYFHWPGFATFERTHSAVYLLKCQDPRGIGRMCDHKDQLASARWWLFCHWQPWRLGPIVSQRI